MLGGDSESSDDDLLPSGAVSASSEASQSNRSRTRTRSDRNEDGIRLYFEGVHERVGFIAADPAAGTATGAGGAAVGTTSVV